MRSVRSSRPVVPSIGPQSVRYINEMRALNVLFREGGMSRAALARQLGLNRSTTGNIIGNLIEDGLVAEHPDTAHVEADYRTGRPGILIELERDRVTFLGAEIGVDRLTVIAIDLRGQIVAKRSVAFPTAESSPDAASDRLTSLVGDVLAKRTGPVKVGGFGVAIPALIAGDDVREASLIGWHDVPLASLLRKRLSRKLGAGLPILVENDANAFAMAETYSGTSGRSDLVAFFLIEAGAGGGIVIGGRLLRGANGVAGEFGHLQMDGDGYVVDAGKRGRLETYIGKAAVLARYQTHGGPRGATLETFLAALACGDQHARLTALDWAAWLTAGLLHVINVINPGLVIIGGSVGAMFGFVADVVEAGLLRGLSPGQPPPRVELSRFTDEGAAFGCASLMHQRMFSIDQAVFPSQAQVEESRS